ELFPPFGRTDAIRRQGSQARHQCWQDAAMEGRHDPSLDRKGWKTMTISPPDAWAFGRVLCDQPLNGELDAMAEPWKTMAARLYHRRTGRPRRSRQDPVSDGFASPILAWTALPRRSSHDATGPYSGD